MTESRYQLIIQFFSEVNFKLIEGDKLWIECDEEKLRSIIDEDADIYDDFTKKDTGGFKLTNSTNEIFGFLFYPTIKNFYNNLRRFINSKKPTIVFNEGENLFYGYFNNTSYINTDKINSNEIGFFSSILDYSEFEKIWISEGHKANEDDNLFNFIDYYNTSKNSFLLVSSGSRSVIKIPSTYEDDIRKIDPLNTHSNLENFKKLVISEKDKTIHFLKNEIIKRSKSNSNNLLNIFWNFDDIFRSAYKSYLIFIEDISLEKLQNEYDEFKNEYLRSYSDLISKILFKIISAPITFGAVTFALSRIQSNTLIITLLAGLIATSILIYYSLKSHLMDLITITHQLETKSNQIKSFEFFKVNNDEVRELEKYLTLVKNKIKLAITFLIASFLLTFLFTSIVVAYPIFQKLIIFWKNHNPYVFESYSLLNLIIGLIFIFYSLVFLIRNCKYLFQLHKSTNKLSFIE